MSRSNAKGKVLLYIDNSNIFINTQKYSAQIKRFPMGVQDGCCRVKIGKLYELAHKGREVLHAKLYGSEPPALDTVWDAIRKKQIEVSVTPRSTWNDREKEIDTKLTADAVENIIMNKDQANYDGSAVILLSGDKDMLSVVTKARKFGWNVEIWSYKNALCQDLAKEKGDTLQVFHIDDFFDEISFYATTFVGRIPKDRSVVLSYEKQLQLRERQDFLNRIVNIACEVFRLPIMARYISDDNSHLVLICCVDEKRNDKTSDEVSICYDFNRDVWGKRDTLVDKVRKEYTGLTDVKILTYIQYTQSLQWDLEEMSAQDAEVYYVNDPDYPVDVSFTVVRHKQQKIKQKYSSGCLYSFRCRLGFKCGHSHSDSEKEYFKEEPLAKKRFMYKTRPCYLNNCKHSKNSYLCSFAHCVQEARCLKCKKVGEHWTDLCPEISSCHN